MLILYARFYCKHKPFGRRFVRAILLRMSHAIADLLASRYDNNQPPEIETIKDFVQKNLHETVAVSIRETQIIIHTRSSALAGALRPHMYELKKLCKTKKRLVVRVG